MYESCCLLLVDKDIFNPQVLTLEVGSQIKTQVKKMTLAEPRMTGIKEK